MNEPFSGSYSLNDVQFLLKPIELEDTPIQLKETLIQSGQKHYSELLTHEALPAPEYLKLFYEGMAANQQRVAEHLWILAEQINADRPDAITLISLARAGTPFGVLLKHILQRYFQRPATHYCVSIIRDRGVDQQALSYILAKHSPESLLFIDGWTGKGVIAAELAASLSSFAAKTRLEIPSELYVLSDLSGSAHFAASYEDYLIPSCLLNATVSGLVSRSLYPSGSTNSRDFHGCVYYEQFRPHDLSNYFINAVLAAVEKITVRKPILNRSELKCKHMQSISTQFLKVLAQQYAVSHPHYIKPGIGETSRVLLRRGARLLLLKDLNADATRHLRWLAETKQIPIELMPESPYQAVALIKEIRQ